MSRIENAQVHDNRLHGNVFDDDRFGYGEYITTSTIKEVGSDFVQTNNTRYEITSWHPGSENPDQEQPAPDGETPAQAFKRLGHARVNTAIKRIQLIGNLSNRSSYEYTPEQISKIFAVMRSELDAAEKRFMPRESDKPSFTFDD